MDKLGMYQRILYESDVSYLLCRINYDADGNPEKYDVLDASKSFEEITRCNFNEIISTIGKKERDEYKDGFNWLSFLECAYLYGGKDSFLFTAKNANKEYSFKSIIYDNVYLLILHNKQSVSKASSGLAINNIIGNKYFEEAPYGIFLACNYGKIIDINKRTEEILGYKKKDILGESILSFTHKDQYEKAKKDLLKKRANKERFHSKYIGTRKEGIARIWDVSTVKIDDHHFIGFINDITVESELEQKLKASEKEYKDLFDKAAFGMVYFDVDAKIKWVNKHLLKMLKQNLKDVKGKHISEVFIKANAQELMMRFNKALKSKHPESFEFIINLDGNDINVMSTYNAITNGIGEILGVEVIYVDVTELRRSQKALKESKERFKLMFEDAPLGYQSLDEQGNIMTVNKAWLEMLGYKKSEVLGKPFNNFIVGDHVYYFMRKFPEFKDKGKSHASFEMLKKNGERIKVHLDGRVSRDSEGEFIQTHCILQDVTVQLIAERKLIDSEKKYSSMIENMSDVIMVLGENAEVIYASPNIEKLFGWNSLELLGQPGVMLVHHDDADYISAKFGELLRKSLKTIKVEFRVTCKSGEVRNVYLVAKNLMKDKDIGGVLLNFHDITDKVKLEQEKMEMDQYVRNQQKLESVGTLASGIAHEINNPINGIMNYSQVILDSMGESEIVEDCAREILRETDRVSEIVKNLLDFSRQQKQGLKEADINEIINQTLSLINATLRHDGINLEIDVEDNLPVVICKSSQIQQVLMNLVTNSRDSLNEKYPDGDEDKVIKIQAELVNDDGEKIIRITVEDLGTGIPSHVQNRIFDPFFTTKSRDKGTGLGLSISHGIIKEHGGSLTFETKKGKYTKFYMDLPTI